MTTPTPPKEAMAAEVEQVVTCLRLQIAFEESRVEVERRLSRSFGSEDISLSLREREEQGSEFKALMRDAIALLHRQQAEIERLKAQVPQWQPIETAPKDRHAYILVTNKEAGGAWVAHYCSHSPGGFRFDQQWHTMMLNHDHLPNRIYPSRPTLWQPLPSAPTENDHEA